MKKVTPGIAMFFALALLAPQRNLRAQSNGSLSQADKHFASAAAQGGLAEVELGQLAETNAAKGSVKEFGQKMAADHSKANDELKQCAQQLGISLPSYKTAIAAVEKTKLSMYSGEQFDRAYMDAMVKNHRDDVAAFKREAAEGQNPVLKRFAAQTLPIVEQHLRLAERTQQELANSAQASSR